MVAAWPEPVERVSSFLRESGAEARIQEFDDGTPTAADAAAATGCGLDQIVKSLVLVCDDKPVVALVPGDRRLDPAKVARALGAGSARIASAGGRERDGLSSRGGGPVPAAERRRYLHGPPAPAPFRRVGGRGLVAPHGRHRAGRARPARASKPMDVVADRTYDAVEKKES